MTPAQAVVDSHIHFWDTDRFDYPWLQGFSELNRPFVPADLDVGEVQIEALIFVQANPVWDVVDQETAWVQHLREGDRRIQALVAGLPLTARGRGQRSLNDSFRALLAGVRPSFRRPEGFSVKPLSGPVRGRQSADGRHLRPDHQITEVTRSPDSPGGHIRRTTRQAGHPAGQWTVCSMTSAMAR